MDILIVDGKAHQLFPDGAPEFHPAIQVIRDYPGEVEEGWIFNQEDSTFSAGPVEEPEPEETFESVYGAHMQTIFDWQKGRIARGYVHSDDNIYDCDLTSVAITKQIADAMAASGQESINFKLKNNSYVELTAAEVADLATGMFNYVQEVYADEARVRTDLRALRNVDDIEAIRNWTIS